MKQPKVGETYFFVDLCSYLRGNRYVTVTKVGRKYFYADDMRFRISDGYEDSGEFCMRGRVYDDEADYQLCMRAAECKLEIPTIMLKLSAEDVIDVYEYIKAKIKK